MTLQPILEPGGGGRSIGKVTVSPSVKLTCKNGDVTYMAKIDWDDAPHPPICRECHLPLEPVNRRPADSRPSNHSLIPAPKATPPHRDEHTSVMQCDHCVVGDHGRCTGVGCFCGTSPLTYDEHWKPKLIGGTPR